MESSKWPVWRRLPAMTTLQALGVIIAGLLVGGLLPVVRLGHGLDLSPGGLAAALGFTLAIFSAKRPSRRQRRRRAQATRSQQSTALAPSRE